MEEISRKDAKLAKKEMKLFPLGGRCGFARERILKLSQYPKVDFVVIKHVEGYIFLDFRLETAAPGIMVLHKRVPDVLEPSQH